MVAVIQESKLSSKSKNTCIRNYTTVHKDRPHGKGGGLLVFIQESIPFSKQPSSPEALSDPHLEELTIKTDIGITKLIISNIYIPPASSCSNCYQSSIEHLLTTPYTLILGDFNTHHPSWYSRSSDTRGKGTCQIPAIWKSSLINPNTETWQGHLRRNFVSAYLASLSSRESTGVSDSAHYQQISPTCSRPTRF